jgi:hypothetical protein
MNSIDTGRRRQVDGLTAPGKASFDWAILFAALALVVPASGLAGAFFADRSRRKGYQRWKAALAMALWCVFLGVVLTGFLKMPVFP